MELLLWLGRLPLSTLLWLLAIPAALLLIVLIWQDKKYRSGAYYQVTHLPYLAVRQDVGRFGEYHTYKRLRDLEAEGARFLFNVYIPKENEETTEIDVLMIHPDGLFVFESKNYSGWIFGREDQKKWCQMLPAGRGKSHKEFFYNPILQNRTHIRCLQTLLGEGIPMWSVIVFSERCTLKDVRVTDETIRVVNRYDLCEAVSSLRQKAQKECLSKQEITAIYDRLYPCTQVDEAVKTQHIANIAKHMAKESAKAPLEKTVCAHTAEPVADDAPKRESASAETCVQETETPTEMTSLLCPRCGAKLVLRTASKETNAGRSFYGCSRYPKCRYIQPINSDRM